MHTIPLLFRSNTKFTTWSSLDCFKVFKRVFRLISVVDHRKRDLIRRKCKISITVFFKFTVT